MAKKEKQEPEAPAEDQTNEAQENAGPVTQARALLDCNVGGVAYKCNALVEAAADVIEQAAKDGMVDTSPAAVEGAVRPEPPAKPEE